MTNICKCGHKHLEKYDIVNKFLCYLECKNKRCPCKKFEEKIGYTKDELAEMGMPPVGYKKPQNHSPEVRDAEDTPDDSRVGENQSSGTFNLRYKYKKEIKKLTYIIMAADEIIEKLAGKELSG